MILGNQTRGASVPGGSRLREVGQARVFAYEEILGGELLRAGGLGGSVQAELGRLGERVVLLGDQVQGAAAPRERPGEAGQPEWEGEGDTAPVVVPEGGLGLKR